MIQKKSLINIGLIGYGYWGPNLARNLEKSSRFNLKCICDLNHERLNIAKNLYRNIQAISNIDDLLNSNEIEAVAIATPVNSHYQLTKKALECGKHVLVEKPITESFEQAIELVNIAKARSLCLMVDHTFIFTPAVQKIKELINTDAIGDPLYYCAERVNLGIFQPDVNVIWDLAVHDLSILNYITSLKPVKVSACGMSHVDGRPANIAFLTLYYSSTFIAHITINWLSPVKLRRCLIGGSKKMLVYDELNADEKLKVYDRGIEIQSQKLNKDDIYNAVIGYRTGDISIPKLETVEALWSEVEHFADCIESGLIPRSSGSEGAIIVAVLEAASESMNNHGAPVAINSIYDSIS